MLHDDALHWLNMLRLNERLKLKHVPISIAHELIELGLARIRGGNLVITTAGMNGSPLMRRHLTPLRSQAVR